MALLFFIKTTNDDGQIHYHGKTLPRDKAPLQQPVVDPNVNYAGHNLPAERKTFNPAPRDLTNNPSLVVIGGFTLPADVAIFFDGEKVLAIDKILDGVAVTERISRKPLEIEFEFTFRVQNTDGTGYVFPQDAIDDLWTKVWLPDTVQTLQNTYLNKLGIQEIIIESISPTTIRGSKNVPVRMKTIENIPGQSLIVTS